MKWTTVFLVLATIVGLTLAKSSNRKVNWDKITFPEVFPQRLLGPLKPEFITNQIPSGRIIGGEEAMRGSIKHQVGVLINNAGWCGGSLISRSFIITAAHCTEGATLLTIYLGAHNVRDDDEDRREIEITADLIVIHPGWDRPTLANDISVAKFPRAVDFTTMYQPIKLPSRTEAQMDLSDEKVIASGWGRDANNAAGISSVLRYAQLQVQPPTICKHFFSETITPSHICTDTGRGQGTCNGDSGGPLIYTRPDDTHILVGLTSFGSSIGCVAGWPSVFTRIGSYLNWIRDNTDIIIED